MSLAHLTVSHLRCIRRAELEIPPRLSLFYGGNGSGKTSLLEAIFLLGRGRSFRTRNTERLIERGEHGLRVTGEVTRLAAPVRLVFEATRAESVSASVSGRAVESLAELSEIFPVQVIEPGVHRLIEEGGYRRRRWLDWAVFHVEPQFVDRWQRYRRALRQRNAALRSRSAQAESWDSELARLGEEIGNSRRHLIGELEPYWRPIVRALSSLDVELGYLPGWAEGTLLEALKASRARDELRQTTHAGPHRADVTIRVHGRPAREVLSRGQQKLVAAAMNLAQLALLRESHGIAPTLLLDDPSAELDRERLGAFIEEIGKLESQLVLTSLHAESSLFGAPERVFHVEHGEVQPL